MNTLKLAKQISDTKILILRALARKAELGLLIISLNQTLETLTSLKEEVLISHE